MNTRQRRARLALALCALAFALAAPAAALAQEEGQGRPAGAAARPRDEVNHEIQLYLLSASNTAGARGRVPDSLGGVVRQLRAALPYEGYGVAATTFNRVRDGGTIEFRGVGGPPLAPPSPPGTSTPAFYNYSLNAVSLTEGAGGAPFIRLRSIRFGLRVPVQTGTTRLEGSTSGPGYPVIQWEDTGLTTAELSVREGEPTVVGTISTARSEELFVLVINARRAATR
jgi:hypothetical protein